MADWTDWAGKLALDAAKGAAAGSIVPGFGTAGGAAIAVATDILPTLADALVGDRGKAVATQVTDAVQKTLTQPGGEQDPAKVTSLRLQLAQIAADDRAAERDAAATAQAAQLADLDKARQAMLNLTSSKSPLAWGAALLSIVLVIGFFGAIAALLWAQLPSDPASQAVLNQLFATLQNGIIAVISFWIGSSAGSAQKSVTLSSLIQQR